MSSLPKYKRISTAKAANYLGVSRWTLRRWGDKKLIIFTTSRTGYRFYTQADLDKLKSTHSIVRTAVKEPVMKVGKKAGMPVKSVKAQAVAVFAAREETLLLPAAPAPKDPIVVVREEVRVEAAGPEPLIIPAIPDPPKPSRSVFGRLIRILPFTVFAGLCLFLVFPIAQRSRLARQPGMILGMTAGVSSTAFPMLSFRDVVMAAATDSSALSASSVQFFLADAGQPAEDMVSSVPATPTPGNTIYLSSLTNFSNFQDSPFAYLSGSHGPAGPVAIIDNADMLRSHPFFANVHDGDKLLIYKSDGKAILFRPLTNEVVAFAPLDAVPSTSYEQIDGQPVVALRNGMGTPYDMKTFEAELTYVAPTCVVVDGQNASRGDYKQSFIVDISGAKKAEAQELARKLRLTVSDVPSGEYRPPAGVDFLIILGRDRVSLMNYIAPTSTASATPKN